MPHSSKFFPSLDDLFDTTISAPLADEILQYDGSEWINQTLAEAGIAADDHTHPASDIASGTFADARISQSSVTQHEGAIDHDALTSFVSNEHVDHSTINVNAGTLLTGGGTIDSNVTLNVDEASIDHGNIAGLSDDDHSQYIFDSPSSTARNIITPSGGSDALTILTGSGGQFDSWNLINVHNIFTINNNNALSNSYSVSCKPSNGLLEISSENEVVGGGVELFEHSSNGTNSIIFRAPDSISSGYTITLPDPDPTDGFVLQTDGSGNLSWTSGGDALVYMAYASTNSSAISTGNSITVPIDSQQYIRSNAVSLSLSSGEITVMTAGTYEVQAISTTDNNAGGSRTDSTSTIQVDTGGGFSDVSGATGWHYNRNDAQGETTASMQTVVTMDKGDKVRIRMTNESGGGDVLTLADACSISLRQLGD